MNTQIDIENKLKEGNVPHPVDPQRFPQGVTPEEAERINVRKKLTEEGKLDMPAKEFVQGTGGAAMLKGDLDESELEALNERKKDIKPYAF